MTLYAKSFCEEAHVNLHILGEGRTFTILNYYGVQELCNEGDYDWEISLPQSHGCESHGGGGGGGGRLEDEETKCVNILH